MLCSRCSDGAGDTAVNKPESCPHKVCRVKHHHLPFAIPNPESPETPSSSKASASTQLSSQVSPCEPLPL